MPNLAGIPPELGEYKLSILHIFIACIIVSYLYIPLFRKNELLEVAIKPFRSPERTAETVFL